MSRKRSNISRTTFLALLVLAIIMSNLSCLTIKAKSVTKKSPTDISFNTTDLTIKVGQTKKLKAKLKPTKNVNSKVKFKADDKDLISVSSSGVVTGKSEGTCSITATTVNGLVAVCSVTVISADSDDNSSNNTTNNNSSNSNTKIDITGISMDQSISVALNSQYTLNPSISPSNATNRTLTYSASNDNIEVSANGVITGKKYGVAIVTAKSSNGITANCVVTVGQTTTSTTSPERVDLNATQATIAVAGKFTLKPTLFPSTAVDNNIKYYSSNTAVAIVDASGVITGLTKGTATIYVITSNQKANQCMVTVSDQVVDVTYMQFSQTNVSVNVNQTMQLTTYVIPSSATNATVNYYSTDTTVASVTSTGVVTGLKAGTTKVIAYTSNGLQSECTVTVYGSNQNPSVTTYGTITVNGYQISMGDTVETVVAKLGQPIRNEPSQAYNYTFYVYSSNNSLIQIAIVNGKVAGFVQIN